MTSSSAIPKHLRRRALARVAVATGLASALALTVSVTAAQASDAATPFSSGVSLAKPGGGDEPGTHPGKGNDGTDNGRDGIDNAVAPAPATGSSGDSTASDPAAPVPSPSTSLETVVLGEFEPELDDLGEEETEGHGLADPTTFGSSLKTSHDIHVTGATVGITATLAAAFVFLFAFPAELLRLTFVNNYARISRFVSALGASARSKAPRLAGRADQAAHSSRRFGAAMRRARARVIARVPVLGTDWVQVGITALAGAFILSFADPGFPFHGTSARLVLALFLSIVFVIVTMNAAVRVFADRRFRAAAHFNPMPAALLFMAIGAIASRITHFHPGFVIGLVMGVTFSRHLGKRDEAQLALVGAGAFFTVGIVSWAAYGALGEAHHGEASFWHELWREVFTAGTLESFVALVVGMLPLMFLEGRPLFEWSRKVWAAVYVVILVTFITLIVPMSGDFHQTRGNFFLTLAAFLAFAAIAVAVWYAFRVANRRDAERKPHAAAVAKPRT